MNDNNQFELLDILTIISFTLQLYNQHHFAQQATNNEIMQELHKQDAVLLKHIIEQNDRIIQLLETSSDRFVQSTSDADKRP